MRCPFAGMRCGHHKVVWSRVVTEFVGYGSHRGLTIICRWSDLRRAWAAAFYSIRKTEGKKELPGCSDGEAIADEFAAYYKALFEIKETGGRQRQNAGDT